MGKIRAVTTCVKIRKSSLEDNLIEIEKIIDKAGAVKPDVLVLSENVYERGCSLHANELGETIPGRLTRALGDKAKQLNTFISFSMYERVDSNTLFNTAVLIDRDGHIAGVHRKTHLSYDEMKNGVLISDVYDVFQTGIGKIGLMICKELAFPEVAQMLRKNGAEIILASSIGDYSDKYVEIAGKNGVYLVVAGQDSISGKNDPSMIVSPSGTILGSVKDISSVTGIYKDGDGSIAYADIDI